MMSDNENAGVEQTIAEARQLAEGATTMDTFDFQAYVESKTKLPKFDVTVCLDAEAATSWNELRDTISQIRADKELLRTTTAPASPKPVRSIADINENDDKQAAYEYQIQSAEAEMKHLADKVRESSLTFTFKGLFPAEVDDIRIASQEAVGFDPTRQAPAPPDPNGNLTDEQFRQALDTYQAAEKQYNELGNKASTEFTSRLIVASVDKVVNGKGQTHNGAFTRDNLDFLRTKLIMSEWGKIVQANQKATFVGSVFTNVVDAGFPGRGTDVAG